MKTTDQPTILVTGSGGQLGNELKAVAIDHPGYRFLFPDKAELPVEDFIAVENYFGLHQIAYCINCAAYTAVDKAETEKGKAFLINADAVGNLAAICKQHKTQLIHISTDYVFDGTAQQPYKETDSTSPINIYGESKLKGEQLALQHDPSAIIIRSSWLYSSFGNNFVKTMLRLMKEKESINVVNDQTGCPTYAADLANTIMQVIVQLPTCLPDRQAANCQLPTIFNYANTGATNWYEFANTIKALSGANCIIHPISTTEFVTTAKRPQYSVLDTTKIRDTFNINIPDWKDSLKNCLNLLK